MRTQYPAARKEGQADPNLTGPDPRARVNPSIRQFPRAEPPRDGLARRVGSDGDLALGAPVLRAGRHDMGIRRSLRDRTRRNYVDGHPRLRAGSRRPNHVTLLLARGPFHWPEMENVCGRPGECTWKTSAGHGFLRMKRRWKTTAGGRVLTDEMENIRRPSQVAAQLLIESILRRLRWNTSTSLHRATIRSVRSVTRFDHGPATMQWLAHAKRWIARVHCTKAWGSGSVHPKNSVIKEPCGHSEVAHRNGSSQGRVCANAGDVPN